MTDESILQQRLHRQHLSQQPYTLASDVVASLVAMQAQDFASAKWALGLRLPNGTNTSVDTAFNAGEILRTHVLRPTWHFVAPKDIRWLLQLTAPHVHALSDYYYRKKELDKKVFAQCNSIIINHLQGHNYLTRDELKQEFDKAKVFTDSIRLSYIMMYAELEGLICSGPRKGKQFTYALMDERVPATPTLQRDEALAQLTLRYFDGHAPATAHDFAKWSGLKIGDANAGIESVKTQLTKDTFKKHTMWYVGKTPNAIPTKQSTYLLPTYDEYLIGYKVNELFFEQEKTNNSFVFESMVLIDGKIKGNWRRTLKKDTVLFSIKMFAQPTKTLQQQIEKQCTSYATFFGLKAEVSFV